jgi:4-hydroxy-tetrahydrodipicolinate reductase
MKIGIVGCAGRMGRALIQQVLDTPGCSLAGGTEQPGAAIGQDLGTLVGRAALGVVVTADADALFAASDAVIDFTVATATANHAALAKQHKTPLVVGTTAVEAEGLAALKAAAQVTAIMHAPNMSVGVNILFAMTEKLAATLGPEFDIDILEMHHRHKIDAPSGTALGLGEAAAKGRGVKLADVARRSRDGITGARPVGEIGFATLRGGDVVGDHTVIFATDGERIELSHKASSRTNFARGAVRAALWTKGRPPGLYSMRDVLGL